MGDGAQANHVSQSRYANVSCERLALNIGQAQEDAPRLSYEADEALQKDSNTYLFLGRPGLNVSRGKPWYDPDSDRTNSPGMENLKRAKAEATAMVAEYNGRCKQADMPAIPDVQYPPSRWDRDRAAQPKG